MTRNYSLKLEQIVKEIIDIYNKIDNMPIEYNTASSRLRPIIYKEVNRMLDYLKKELENRNPRVEAILKKEENRDVLEMIKQDKRLF